MMTTGTRMTTLTKSPMTITGTGNLTLTSGSTWNAWHWQQS